MTETNQKEQNYADTLLTALAEVSVEWKQLKAENLQLREALEVVARCMQPMKDGKHISIYPNSTAHRAVLDALEPDSHDGRRFEQQNER